MEDTFINHNSFTFPGINSALVGLSKEILDKGVWRENNGFQKETANSCLELPYPVCVEITNPGCREVMLEERKWNRILPHAESLWILLGWNNLDDFTGRYVKNLYTFADDEHTWRAGYGPRMRGFTGVKTPYLRGIDFHEQPSELVEVDQLKYVVETLKREPTSRQALITIHDPGKDSDLELKTKDQPCTRSLHFMVVNGRLNCYVTMRSNDIINGFSAVNVFNFTFMQEYISYLTGIPMGKYYHIAHNLHVYENQLKLLITLSKISMDKAVTLDESCVFTNEMRYGEYFSYFTNPMNHVSYESFIKEAEKTYNYIDKLYNLNKNKDLTEDEVKQVIYDAGSDLSPFFFNWFKVFGDWGKRVKPLFQLAYEKYTLKK